MSDSPTFRDDLARALFGDLRRAPMLRPLMDAHTAPHVAAALPRALVLVALELTMRRAHAYGAELQLDEVRSRRLRPI